MAWVLSGFASVKVWSSWWLEVNDFFRFFFNQVKDFWIRNLFSTNVKYLLRLQGGHNLRTAALLGNSEALPDPRSKVLILSPFATSYDKDYEIKNWSIEVDEPKEPTRLEIERRVAELSTIIIARPKLSISSLLATSYNKDYEIKNLSPEKDESEERNRMKIERRMAKLSKTKGEHVFGLKNVVWETMK